MAKHKGKTFTFPNSTITTQQDYVGKVLTAAKETKRFSVLASLLIESELYTPRGRGIAATVLRIPLEELETMLEQERATEESPAVAKPASVEPVQERRVEPIGTQEGTREGTGRGTLNLSKIMKTAG